MRPIFLFVYITLILLSVIAAAGTLESDFLNPPRQAGVRCWWWWLNSNVTKEAITRDLEAMHDKGFSGAMIFDAGTETRWGPDKNPPNGPMFSSTEWTELYLHALKEARRLGLEIGLSIQSGWNLGGPGVTLDDKAKQITSSEIHVEGAKLIDLKLPVPKSNYGYYSDICVLAYPSKYVEVLPFKLSASSSQFKFPVTNITMGDFWVSGGTKRGEGPTSESPEWIEFAFKEVVKVSGLVLEGRKGYGPKLCRLEAADTGQKTNTFELIDGDNILSFNAIESKIIRIVFEDSYDPSHPDSPRNVQVVAAQLLDDDGKALTAGATVARKSIKDLTAKSGARELGGSAPDCRFLLNDYPAVEGEEDTLVEDIIDITDKLSKDGVLKWKAPAGKWTILRIGYTPTHAHVATSSDNWKGHVLDYLSKDAFNRYWDAVVDPLLKKAGPMAGTVLKQLETDSWECGGMNWSPKFAEEFKRYNGYDIVKYLPVIAGKIVESRQASNAFLADLRKTIAHLVSENHYRTFSENAARYKIGIQPECSGPHSAPIDGITNYSHSDIVMSEFWIPSPHRPNPPNRFFVKQASSAAHIYGKQFVGAESFTSLKKPHWGVELWHDMKPHMDYEFCEGLNMIFFHTFTCSPKEMGIPGQEYFAGTHVNPQVTWWDKSDAFMDYMKRIQSVVQKGKFVADVLYYYGDHVPNIAVNKGFNQAGSLPGYDYDVTNEEVLLKLKVVDGKVLVPGGIEYRALVLPDHKVLSLAALEKVEKLLKNGVTVIGPKPERLVSLVGGQEAQQKFYKLSDKLWGDSPAKSGQKRVGKGRLVWGMTSRQFLQNDGIAFDFEVLGVNKQEDYQYIHYTIDDADVYFVCNQTKQMQSVNCAFRVSGKQPELWDPVTGEIIKAGAFQQADGLTTVPIEFDPFGSCFVVFKESVPATKQGIAKSNYPKLNVVKEVKGTWQVEFDTKWGGPGSVGFKTLADWAQHADEGIKYYSGEADYRNTFELEPVRGKRYWLQLNEVLDAGIAAVKLNGKDVGISWTKPFRLEITDAVKSGWNKLEITVVNTWQNRLIGDRGKEQKERFTETNIKIRDDWKLRPCGLLGPVEIKLSVQVADDYAIIDAETVKKWSAPYRGWHYYPDHVIKPKPNIKRFENVHMTDVPTVFQLPDDKKWYMTFIGFDGKGYQSFIAESDDLVKWSNIRLAMGYGKKGEFDFGGRVLGAYLYEDYDIKAPRILKKKDGKYFSLYGAYPRQGGYELKPGYEGIASSADGITWQRAQDEPILSVFQEDCGQWEKVCIYQPWLTEHEGTYYNHYNAKYKVEQIGMATSSDLFKWTRYEHNPVIPVGPNGSYQDQFSADGKIFRDGDHWVCFFFGVGKGGAHIMVAYSCDLYNWTVDPEPLYKADGNPSGLDRKYAHKISLVWNQKNETFYMYYCAVGDQGRGIGLITSKPLTVR